MINKVNGQFANDIQNNTIVKEMQSRFKEVANEIRQRNATICFLRKLRMQDDNTKRMLILNGFDETDLQNIKDVIECSFKTEVERSKISKEVLGALMGRQHDIKIDGLATLIERLSDIENFLSSGEVLIEHCVNPKLLWGDLLELPDICNEVRCVVHSDVFWNVSLSTVMETFERNSIIHEEFILTSLKFLFCQNDEDIRVSCNEDISILSFIPIEYIKCLKNVGIRTYVEKWNKLVKEKDVPMEKVKPMFVNMTKSITDEMHVYEAVSLEIINPMTRKALLLLFEFEELKDNVDILNNVFAIFNFDVELNDDTHRALCAFENIYNLDVDETFVCIERDLLVISDMLDNVQDNTCRALGLVVDSSQLLEFLREIEHEDVRNLVDAVEDISESYVQEVTVTALIETKKFVQSIEFIRKEKETFVEFLRCVNKHFEANETSLSKLPEKINDCISNLHNLKSLYNNVANRGQQTKEIIQSLLKKGKIVFALDELTSSVKFKVVYKEGKLIEKK